MAHNKKDLINHIYGNVNLSKEQLHEALDAIFSGIVHFLEQGEPVRIRGFGAFVIQDVPERPGRNPRTGEQIQVAPSKRARLRPSIELKRALNKPETIKTKAKDTKPKKAATVQNKKVVTKSASKKR